MASKKSLIEDLPAAVAASATETAQSYLEAAHRSVKGIISTFESVRQERGKQGSASGMTDAEADLLRAAIVFTGAGIDATLKQLMRDALPTLLDCNPQAQTKFETFAAQRLGTGEIADTRMIARFLVASNPRERLIEDYIYDRTGSSLQSAEEVGSAASALGIDDADLHKSIRELRPLFVARNQVSHELDLQEKTAQGVRRKRHRKQKDLEPCNAVFVITQMIVNHVSEELMSPATH